MNILTLFCAVRGVLKFLVLSLRLFHPVLSECVAVRREEDYVFWCSNGIGWHCWAFDQFHQEWPVRKAYRLTEVRFLWVIWVFFFFFFPFNVFSMHSSPFVRFGLCLLQINVFSTPGLFCLPKCVHFLDRGLVEYCSVLELGVFTAQWNHSFLCGLNENGLNQSDGCFIEKDLQWLNS